MQVNPSPENSLADDIIRGVEAIALFLGEPKRRVFYLCAEGYIPAGKVGGRWVASKTRLRQHYAEVTGGGGAAN
jgi:hypothetical protein